eukprot:TRINITY_DN3786_c0_g1_i1.p1 TRINITY_DN3786_c0_g1~~TRINITY_DN3786_c0_g1_i1.p1  ORF type:complete len:388 (-),score=76.32 TRINITY_DN3786_c0_g1_i1:101-1264(-)
MKLFALLLLLLTVSVAGQSCTQCEILASALKTLVSNNATVQTIQNTLLQYCSLFSPTEKSQCITFVKSSLTQAIKFVQQYDNPAQVCQVLGYCTSQKLKVSNAVTCPICEYLVGLAEKWIAENATEQRIFNLFETACNILPGDSKYVCRAAVEQYGKQIIQLLINNEDPQKVCQIVQLCTSSKFREVKADPVPCYLCKYLVQTLETFVTENTTEAEIITLADNICNILPSSLKQSCQSYVDVYLPQLIQFIIAKEDPNTVCAAASLCSTRISVQSQSANVARKLPADAQTCQLCNLMFLALDGYLSSNATEQAILQYADAFCAKLGGLKATCDALVAEELPVVVKYIISQANPTTACTELGLCPASRAKMNKMMKYKESKVTSLLKK